MGGRHGASPATPPDYEHESTSPFGHARFATLPAREVLGGDETRDWGGQTAQSTLPSGPPTAADCRGRHERAARQLQGGGSPTRRAIRLAATARIAAGLVRAQDARSAQFAELGYVLELSSAPRQAVRRAGRNKPSAFVPEGYSIERWACVGAFSCIRARSLNATSTSSMWWSSRASCSPIARATSRCRSR